MMAGERPRGRDGAAATFLLATASLLAAVSPLDAEEITGRVETAAGALVEHARVEDVRGERSSYTDHKGRFTLDCDSPCLLLVSHPRFAERLLEPESAPEVEIVVVLGSKQEVYEEIVVSASRGGDGLAPVSIASTVRRPEDAVAAPATLTELVEGVPGVAENGQGGIFQVFSIRGVSGQRVMTLVSGRLNPGADSVKIAVDAMGGDHAPRAVVDGVGLAVTDGGVPRDRLLLVGRAKALHPLLAEYRRLLPPARPRALVARLAPEAGYGEHAVPTGTQLPRVARSRPP